MKLGFYKNHHNLEWEIILFYRVCFRLDNLTVVDKLSSYKIVVIHKFFYFHILYNGLFGTNIGSYSLKDTIIQLFVIVAFKSMWFHTTFIW